MSEAKFKTEGADGERPVERIVGRGVSEANEPGQRDKDAESSASPIGRVPIGKLLNCDCLDWGTKLTQQQIRETLGAYFHYCPWCGKPLIAEMGSELL